MAGQTAPTLSEDKDSTNDWDCKTKGNFVLQSQYNYADNEASEVSHHLNDNLIPFRNFWYASLGVEVFLVIDSYVADKGFCEAQRDAARHTTALIVGDLECSICIRLAVKVPYTVAMVAHEIIACQCRHLAERAAPERYVVAYETVEGMYGIEGII